MQKSSLKNEKVPFRNKFFEKVKEFPNNSNFAKNFPQIQLR